MHSNTGPSRRVRIYLELMRPANVVTALADVLAGMAAAGLLAQGWVAGLLVEWPSALALLVSTSALYAGGVVLNDVFDAPLDAEERPERPIPSGRITRNEATLLGSILLITGVATAAIASIVSSLIALIIAVSATIYDSYGKHHTWLGPLNMGLCRGFNLLLGVSIIPAMLTSWWLLAAIPVVYIAAITAISQGEVHGGTSRTGWMACGLVAAVIMILLILGYYPSYVPWIAAPFALLLAIQVLPPFVKAARQPDPDRIRAAVKAGVLALITLNATLAAGFAGWIFGLLVLALLPLSYVLSRAFAVT